MSRRGFAIAAVPPWYVAPRIGDATAQGRTIRRARCGHAVYVCAQGLEATGRRGKRLLCARCAAALSAEQGCWMEGSS